MFRGLWSGPRSAVLAQLRHLERHGAGGRVYRPLHAAGGHDDDLQSAVLQGLRGRGQQVADHAAHRGPGRGPETGQGGGGDTGGDGLQHPVLRVRLSSNL